MLAMLYEGRYLTDSSYLSRLSSHAQFDDGIFGKLSYASRLLSHAQFDDGIFWFVCGCEINERKLDLRHRTYILTLRHHEGNDSLTFLHNSVR
ncbi:hypothetical protein Bpfe_023377 [Biomphalaria pfeifferi]|uniref:Uncharacterized protein n=1 Tax=Biomphalaria pfeifferi TaxID=112525 RepID=A0AAD8B395_BIOPF|nr:hypothetical protein Bpfe_023377 [Biomphalaria pfeifferi]